MIRVIVNGVSFYTTKKLIESGVGSNTSVNMAVSAVYELMKTSKTKLNGIGSRIAVYNHKMEQEYFDVQIDK
jgi:hypothetical protein